MVGRALPGSRRTGTRRQARETMLSIYRGFEELDADALDQNFSHTRNLLAFGTDWDEKFSGWDKYKGIHTVQFAALKSFKFRSRELEVQVHGGVAWAADRPQWAIETKAGETVKADLRVTAVLTWSASRGRWLVVQWHVSSGLKERMHGY